MQKCPDDTGRAIREWPRGCILRRSGAGRTKRQRAGPGSTATREPPVTNETTDSAAAATDPTGVYYVTTPIYYVNAKLHIGGAYTTLVGDTLARYYRACGRKVFYLTGSDEHGQKIANVAEAQGKTPQQLADEIVPYFHELWKQLDISHDLFIRTTDRYHERVVQSFFQKLKENGYVSKGHYKSLYCTGCEKPLGRSELDDEGRCPIHRTKPDEIEEENWFLEVEPFKDKLRQYLTATPARLLPDGPRAKVLNDLEDFERQSVSRRKENLSWGVEMPGDPEHVIWVWFDALINYISGLVKDDVEGKWANTPDPIPWDDLIKGENFQTFWPECVHLIGKDILWHHTLIWWTMLLGVGLAPPKLVYAHGWWTVENHKISKSLGTAIDPTPVSQRFGNDALRYFVLREMTFGKDGDFSIGQLVNRINSDLGKGGLGNLVQRTLNLTEKYCPDGAPEVVQDVLQPADAELARAADELAESYCKHIESYRFHLALDDLWKVVRLASQYIDDQAPWKLAKEEGQQARLDCVLWHLCEVCRLLGEALEPVLPDASAALRQKLGQTDAVRAGSTLPQRVRWGLLKPGTKLEKGEQLFPSVASPLEITGKLDGETLHVSLAGFLDSSTHDQLREFIQKAGKGKLITGLDHTGGAVEEALPTRPTAATFDFAGLAYCSAPGAKAFSACKKAFDKGKVEYVNAPDNFDELLQGGK